MNSVFSFTVIAFPLTLFVMTTLAALWPSRMTPLPVIDTPEVTCSAVGNDDRVAAAAALMAVCTAAEAQLAAVIVAASDVPAPTILITMAIRSRRISLIRRLRRLRRPSALTRRCRMVGSKGSATPE